MKKSMLTTSVLFLTIATGVAQLTAMDANQGVAKPAANIEQPSAPVKVAEGRFSNVVRNVRTFANTAANKAKSVASSVVNSSKNALSNVKEKGKGFYANHPVMVKAGAAVVAAGLALYAAYKYFAKPQKQEEQNEEVVLFDSNEQYQITGEVLNQMIKGDAFENTKVYTFTGTELNEIFYGISA